MPEMLKKHPLKNNLKNGKEGILETEGPRDTARKGLHEMKGDALLKG